MIETLPISASRSTNSPVISRENAHRVLSDMVAIPSVNPMGVAPWESDVPVERGITAYLEQMFAPYAAQGLCTLQRIPCAPFHENLLISVPGRNTDLLPILLESHMDTVPADEWMDRAFTPRIEGDTLYGRGACDDKGSLAAMALAVADLLETGTVPPRPVLFLAAGDEECAQTGIKDFCARNIRIARGVFGEPTRLFPVIQHKGTLRWDITVGGKSAHTSRPELGHNAILDMLRVIESLQTHQTELQAIYPSPLIGTGPTLTVTKIAGGRTRNAVPDFCTIALDFRLVPGMNLEVERERVLQRLAGLGFAIEHSDLQLRTPPLSTMPDDPFCQIVLDACRAEGNPNAALTGEPYGTDASWVSAQAPAVVLGPGDIRYAHAIDERIDLGEVEACARIYRRILLSED